jgi:hypothetical protein
VAQKYQPSINLIAAFITKKNDIGHFFSPIISKTTISGMKLICGISLLEVTIIRISKVVLSELYTIKTEYHENTI